MDPLLEKLNYPPHSIPFCDLKKDYLPIEKEVKQAINKVFSEGCFILGKEVESFEQEFAEYCKCAFGTGVASGTEALQIAILSCNVTPGDEIITVANAGVPTIAAITSTGALPVFVDIDLKSYNIDVSKIEQKITNKTRAILPVHLFGQCADMDPILRISKKYNLKVIEDACQAAGAMYKGKKAGSIGDVGCFSFYPTKNLGAYGDGGIIITNNSSLDYKAKMLRNYGQTQKNFSELRGINSRLDEIQAAILRTKLQHLDKWNNKRLEIAQIYNKNIANIHITKPSKLGYGIHIYHLYVIACPYRDKLQSYLTNNKIQTLIHYPIPVYKQIAYREFNKCQCLITEEFSKKILSLPLYPSISKEEIYYICEILNKFKI